MSSGLLCCGVDTVEGVGEHGAVDDVGEASFQRSDGLFLRVPGVESALDERFGVRVAADLGDGDPMKRCVDLPVPTPVEPEPFPVR